MFNSASAVDSWEARRSAHRGKKIAGERHGGDEGEEEGAYSTAAATPAAEEGCFTTAAEDNCFTTAGAGAAAAAAAAAETTGTDATGSWKGGGAVSRGRARDGEAAVDDEDMYEISY